MSVHRSLWYREILKGIRELRIHINIGIDQERRIQIDGESTIPSIFDHSTKCYNYLYYELLKVLIPQNVTYFSERWPTRSWQL